MRYIWVFMLAIAYLVWSKYSIEDFLYCRKTFVHPLEHIEVYTGVYIGVHIIGLFFGSLIYWLYCLGLFVD